MNATPKQYQGTGKMRSNNTLERTVTRRGRTVLAVDCVLAGAQWHRGRPLNSVVEANDMGME